MTDTPALVARPTQAEVHYKSHVDDERQCQHCRWYVKEGDGGPYCHLVETIPADIHADGGCDRHEALPHGGKEAEADYPHLVLEGDDPQFVDDKVTIAPNDHGVTIELTTDDVVAPANDKAALSRIWNSIKSAIKRDNDSQASGIKVYGDRWFAWWSNAYEDREKEFFPAKAIDDYIARVDMGIVPYPELWVWHIPGSRHGQADWLGRIGNFAVASGTFDDTPAGRSAKAAYQRKGQRYQMSHGFFYDTAKKKDGVYHQFNTFELTTIPAKAKAAANSFTDFQGATPMLTPEKKAELETLLGKEAAEQLIAQTEAKDKALVEFGVAYKDFVDVSADGANTETEAAKEAVESASKDFTTLLVDLVGDHAHISEQVAQMAKAVTAYKQSTDATIKAQNDTIAKLQEELDQRPRSASKDEATELTKARLEAMDEAINKQSKTIHPLWGTEVTSIE